MKLSQPRGAAAGVAVRAHAKINVSLHVTGTRPDGYHLLKTVFQSLALHDRLAFEPCDGPFALDCSAPGVPCDERNLVWKAAKAVWQCAGRQGEPHGVRAHIAKRIPAQGGLGGGSADAAAALVALDALWGTGLGEERLQVIAGQLGADVPFFLCGGSALGLGRGDEIYPLADLPARSVVLVFPPFGVSTPEAFRWFDEDGGPCPSSIPAARVLWPDGTGVAVLNELQAAVGRRHREIDEVCRQLREQGAEAAAMTGSGSTVFGLFRDDAAGAAAAAALSAAGWHTLVTRFATRRQVFARRGLSGRGPLV